MVNAQACESRPIRVDWAFQEESFKDTGVKTERSHTSMNLRKGRNIGPLIQILN